MANWKLSRSLGLGALTLGLALGLIATRRVPVPTPGAGFYRVETTVEATTRVLGICFAPGHGNNLFGGRATEDQTTACGGVNLSAMGDGWQALQRCSVNGRTVDFVTVGTRQGPGVWTVRATARPLASRLAAPHIELARISRIGSACPARWRRGDYLIVNPHPAGEPYSVWRIGSQQRDGLVTYPVLPTQLARQLTP